MRRTEAHFHFSTTASPERVTCLSFSTYLAQLPAVKASASLSPSSIAASASATAFSS